MEWELDAAKLNGVPVIGVIPYGNTRSSNMVTSRSKTDVRWNTDSIISAIRSYAR